MSGTSIDKKNHNHKSPALFISQGNPMLAMDCKAGEAFKKWGHCLAKPKTLLVFCTHWEEDQPAFGETVQHNDLIDDFFGFPAPLYPPQYPAPGAPGLMKAVENALGPQQPKSRTKRGLYHGLWEPF